MSLQTEAERIAKRIYEFRITKDRGKYQTGTTFPPTEEALSRNLFGGTTAPNSELRPLVEDELERLEKAAERRAKRKAKPKPEPQEQQAPPEDEATDPVDSEPNTEGEEPSAS